MNLLWNQKRNLLAATLLLAATTAGCSGSKNMDESSPSTNPIQTPSFTLTDSPKPTDSVNVTAAPQPSSQTYPAASEPTKPSPTESGAQSTSAPADAYTKNEATPAPTAPSASSLPDGWKSLTLSDEKKKEIMEAADDSDLKIPLVAGIVSSGVTEVKVKTGPNSMMMLNYSEFTVIECPKEFKGVAFALSFTFDGKAGDKPIPIKVKFPKGEQSGLYKKQGSTYVAVVSNSMKSEDIQIVMDHLMEL